MRHIKAPELIRLCCHGVYHKHSPKPKMIAELEEILLWQPNSGSNRQGCKSFKATEGQRCS